MQKKKINFIKMAALSSVLTDILFGKGIWRIIQTYVHVQNKKQ
jgi:hypothetical protein